MPEKNRAEEQAAKEVVDQLGQCLSSFPEPVLIRSIDETTEIHCSVPGLMSAA